MPDSVYCLPAVMDMQTTTQLQRYLLGRLTTRMKGVMDAGALERIATPGIQCLLAAQASFQEAGLSYSILNPSPYLLAALADMNIGGLTQEIHV